MRIGVDGLMGSGKTMFADALARRIPATRLSIDDFHRPAAERMDYYTDAFDLRAFRAAVEGTPGVVIADGIFLHKPELRGVFDLTIWLTVDPDVARGRAIERDRGWMADAVERYATRYAPAGTRYLAESTPQQALASLLTAYDEVATE